MLGLYTGSDSQFYFIKLFSYRNQWRIAGALHSGVHKTEPVGQIHLEFGGYLKDRH